MLRLTGSDGELSAADDVEVIVFNAGTPPNVLNLPIATSADDAEERMSTGAVDLISGDNNLGYDSLVQQTVGLRFPGVALPQGARITAAWVQFQVDEVSTEAASLTFAGEAADSAGALTATTRNLSSRCGRRRPCSGRRRPGRRSLSGLRPSGRRTLPRCCRRSSTAPAGAPATPWR